MPKLMKSLLAVSAVLTLAPTAALALPPQCDDICWDKTCDYPCAFHNRWATCADWNIVECASGVVAPTEPSASVMPGEALQADDVPQVCSEEHPEASAES
ncbi:hypothetical protein ACIHQR_18740 [Corallococcus coralloides]|uniref:hypothetical protein n=1 Tax=Corallococcus coralloides TaxID=184914 RepID=UPI00384D2C96